MSTAVRAAVAADHRLELRGPIVVTGGAGFIGCNLVHRLASNGHAVRVVDNLSRPGVEHNAQWLREMHSRRVDILLADVRDSAEMQACARGASAIFHLAAQVAVTTSLSDPLADFDVNARGTLNVLEAARAQPSPPPVVLTSTNKVYGDLQDIGLAVQDGRYLPTERELRSQGIDEKRPLQFHSPYGCSKGAADQYVIDYARSFGIATAVLRMSCIYGPRQFGTEDQGWVAHFLLQALRGQPITIFGDGQQVRDILYVDDLTRALEALMARAPQMPGAVFNIGGGPANTISLNSLLNSITRLTGQPPQTQRGPWRVGDQRYYVSDSRALQRALGWRAQVGSDEGICRLFAWLKQWQPPPHAPARRAASLPAAGATAASAVSASSS